ncbi:MAG: hypothetical protein II252_05895 [Clostridia bacterium]|nr:hypothetical protein [Clostridia bacterium]
MINNYAKMEEVGIKNIVPNGWLHTFLENQADGLTGNLEVAGYPFNCCSWDTPNAKKEKEQFPRWWPYEQTGYYRQYIEHTSKSEQILITVKS